MFVKSFQIVNCKNLRLNIMENKADFMSDRLLKFGAEVIRIVRKTYANQINRHIGMQLLRSATSVGANYEEARGAESRQDFSHKMQIILKEARESLFWLKLISKSVKTLKSTPKK
jgi:four helix bundle protein